MCSRAKCLQTKKNKGSHYHLIEKRSEKHYRLNDHLIEKKLEKKIKVIDKNWGCIVWDEFKVQLWRVLFWLCFCLVLYIWKYSHYYAHLIDVLNLDKTTKLSLCIRNLKKYAYDFRRYMCARVHLSHQRWNSIIWKLSLNIGFREK